MPGGLEGRGMFDFGERGLLGVVGVVGSGERGAGGGW